jgi:hypothetical protein
MFNIECRAYPGSAHDQDVVGAVGPSQAGTGWCAITRCVGLPESVDIPGLVPKAEEGVVKICNKCLLHC